LQGNKTGRQFLSKIQEGYFIYNNDFFNEEILMEYAELTDLDLDEFANDIFSNSAKKAFQTDLKLIKEMHIKEFPSLVFSSKHNKRPYPKVTYNVFLYYLKSLVSSAYLLATAYPNTPAIAKRIRLNKLFLISLPPFNL